MSRAQLLELGLSSSGINARVAKGRMVAVEEGVFAIAPVLEHDDWGRWMAATLTAPGSVLSHWSAAAAWGFWTLPRSFETVTRPGNGGPRRHGGILVHRSYTLAEETEELRDIPITSAARTVVDLAAHISRRALARAVRESIRLERTTLEAIADSIGRHPRRRGVSKLRPVIASYSGLPLERARSGAEVRALQVIRNARRPLPNLNHRIAGEEADLSWPRFRLIIEIDGGPFHLDAGEDARKERCWKAAGWRVERLPSDDVYERPTRLLALAPLRTSRSNTPPGTAGR